MASSEEISENVKQAREFALMDDYEQAKVCYCGAIQGVQQILKQVHESEQKQRWREVNAAMFAFMYHVLDNRDIVQCFCQLACMYMYNVKVGLPNRVGPPNTSSQLQVRTNRMSTKVSTKRKANKSNLTLLQKLHKFGSLFVRESVRVQNPTPSGKHTCTCYSKRC